MDQSTLPFCKMLVLNTVFVRRPVIEATTALSGRCVTRQARSTGSDIVTAPSAPHRAAHDATSCDTRHVDGLTASIQEAARSTPGFEIRVFRWDTSVTVHSIIRWIIR